MAVLTREQILAANDLGTDVVHVPEWGGDLQVRGLTLGEVNHIVALSTKNGAHDNLLGAIYTFVRGVQEPKFTDLDVDDLKKKSAVVLRVVKRINELSGMTETGKPDTEGAEKN